MELVAEILNIIQDMQIKSSEKFVEAVLKRLESFGYTATSENVWTIAFCIQKVHQHLKNICNTPTVPDGLFYIAVDRVCGELLFALKQTGNLDLENLDLNTAITQIHEGDTTIQFADGASDSEKFTVFVNYLMTEGEGDFVCYRKIKW